MSSNNRTTNLTGKPLREFTPENTLYVRKMINGYDYIYLCRFVRVEWGVIHVAPISCEREYATIPQTMTARTRSCFLWGQRHDDRWACCHWFTSLDAPAGTLFTT